MVTYIYKCQGTLHMYVDEWMVSIFNISMGIKEPTEAVFDIM